jgi:hypothetical protein
MLSGCSFCSLASTLYGALVIAVSGPSSPTRKAESDIAVMCYAQPTTNSRWHSEAGRLLAAKDQTALRRQRSELGSHTERSGVEREAGYPASVSLTTYWVAVTPTISSLSLRLQRDHLRFERSNRSVRSFARHFAPSVGRTRTTLTQPGRPGTSSAGPVT